LRLQLFAGLALGAIYVLFRDRPFRLIFGMPHSGDEFRSRRVFTMVGAYVGLLRSLLGRENFWVCLIAVSLGASACSASPSSA